MGIFSFVKGIGDKISGQAQLDAAGEAASKPVAMPQAHVAPAAHPAPVSAHPATAAEPSAQDMANALLARVQALGLAVDNLSIQYKGDTDTAEVHGKVKTQADREKIILALGNVNHVAQVVDSIEVETPAPESQFYTVKSGDNLSSIAKAVYGNANDYQKIFEANRPLLKDPNKIYVGQVLRLPAA